MNKKIVYAVGIGPGNHSLMTPAAKSAISESNVIVGYNSYIKKIEALLSEKQVIQNGMRKEVERCKAALDEALKGNIVSVISSGDAGIYGMAGLLIELVEDNAEYAEIEIITIPGITAANAAAAVLGAPLMNDFVTFSLSDCLTPKEIIEERIVKLSDADLPCVIYNPRSKTRLELFDKLIAEFAKAQGDDLVCGFVKNCSMPNEEKWVGEIKDLPIEEINMVTVVIIGNSRTINKNNKMIVPRGYSLS